MKIVKYVCDSCKKEKEDHNIINFELYGDRELDASGNSFKKNYKRFDICKECLVKFVLNNPTCKVI